MTQSSVISLSIMCPTVVVVGEERRPMDETILSIVRPSGKSVEEGNQVLFITLVNVAIRSSYKVEIINKCIPLKVQLTNP